MPASTLLEMADHRFLSLTTFRRTGAPVATPVWVARDGDALVVTTAASSGKVKRLRRDPRVELRPCNRRGVVVDDAPVVAAVASAEPPSDATMGALQRRYGLQLRLIMTVERLMSRGRRERVILRITAS